MLMITTCLAPWLEVESSRKIAVWWEWNHAAGTGPWLSCWGAGVGWYIQLDGEFVQAVEFLKTFLHGLQDCLVTLEGIWTKHQSKFWGFSNILVTMEAFVELACFESLSGLMRSQYGVIFSVITSVTLCTFFLHDICAWSFTHTAL